MGTVTASATHYWNNKISNDMITDVDFNSVKEWGKIMIYAVVFVITLGSIRKIVDENGDGRFAWKTELRPKLYFLLLAYMVFKEGQLLGNVYSDMVWIMVSLGVMTVEVISFFKVYKAPVDAKNNHVDQIPEL